MVVALKPGRFYGSSLPRPRILPNVPDDQRCDPPRPVNDSLLRWAADVPWKMGGLAPSAKRFQGKIEGRLSKLKAMEEDPVPEEDAKPPAKNSRSSNLKLKGRFGATISRRSSRWKPHKKRCSRRKSPLRLTVGKDIMRKHEEQLAQLDIPTSGKPSPPNAVAAQNGSSRKRAAPRRTDSRRNSVKRELLVDDSSRRRRKDREEEEEEEEEEEDEEEEEEDEEEEEEDEEEEEEEESDSEAEAFQAKVGAGLPVRRSARLRSSSCAGGNERKQQSQTSSDSESEGDS